MAALLFLLGCFISALVIFFPEIKRFSKRLMKPVLKTEEDKFLDELVNLVCVYLSSPVGWEHDDGRFRFIHKALGIRIWVANCEYGISFAINNANFALTDAQKNQIWTAYSKLKAQADLAENKLLIEDLASKALDFYGNLKYKELV